MDNIFINYYLMFINSGHKTPVTAAVTVLSLVFVGYFLLGVLFIKKRYLVDLTNVKSFSIYYVVSHLMLLAFLYWYYKRKNPAAMVLSFDENGENRKIFWKALSVIILVLPFVLIIGILL